MTRMCAHSPSPRALTEQLMAELAGGTPVPKPAAGEEALGTLRAALDAMPIRMNRKRRNAALGDAAALIREIGMERYDLECVLGTDAHGDEVIVAAAVPPPTAHVWLLGRLFERPELFTLSDEFLAMERQASGWYFGRWGEATRRKGLDSGDFARGVREQEWTFVSRDSLAIEGPMMLSLTDEAFGDMPARQLSLARALLRSVVDVLEVTAVDGSLLTVRSARDGAVYRVHEHNEEARPFPGLVLLGRLIPFDDDTWLRSPGALLFAPADERQLSLLAEGVTRMREALPTPIALEAFISTLIYGAKVPVSRKPAPSAKAARAMLTALYENLEELGFREDVPDMEVPADLLGAATQPGTAVLRFSLDEPMAEWASALAAQAEIGSSGARLRSGTSKKKGEQKRKRGKGTR